jgi:hypothetical protein
VAAGVGHSSRRVVARGEPGGLAVRAKGGGPAGGSRRGWGQWRYGLLHDDVLHSIVRGRSYVQHGRIFLITVKEVTVCML